MIIVDPLTTISEEVIIPDEEGESSSDYDLSPLYTSSDDEGSIDVSSSLMGQTSDSWKELYLLYKKHSRVIGFGVRKSTTRREGGVDGIVTEKYFVCSCEGTFNSGKKAKTHTVDQENRQKRRVTYTRTGCKACLRVKLDKTNGAYVVVKHVVEHNHPLTPSQWQHHHRSERAIPPSEGEVIKIMTEARMPPTVQYNYISASCGGEEHVGHTKTDHLNYVNRLKRKAIASGDAQNVIDMLIKRSSDEPGFFYRVKFDSKNRITCLFWRDAMMKEDFLLYHDVVIFDTTYGTNKYKLICGAFVGINNHWSNTVFGCALVCDETTETFEWLFNTFNESMGGDVFPTSIFTDQDQAMSNAIEKVFSMSRHRLCQWHIQQNAMSYFGSVESKEKFQEMFNKCLTGCYSESEFETAWDMLKLTYGHVNTTWFKRLYGIRQKWSTAFNKDYFSAGILSSQRSESTNHAMGNKTKKTTSLTDLYGILSDTVKRWRSEEDKNEFKCFRSTPSSTLPMMGLVRSAANVYTINIFEKFEDEFKAALATKAVPLGSEDTTMMYKVFPEDYPESQHVVVFDSASFTMSCTCKKYEECGLLCMHCLRVMHLHSLSEIPEKYINTRWTKFAKHEVWKRLRENNSKEDLIIDEINWRSEMLTDYHVLLLRCRGKAEAKAIMKKHRDCALKELDSLSGETSLSEGNDATCQSTSATIMDPPRCTTKGRKARIKRPSKAKAKKARNQGSDGNVVPYIAPQRLI